MLQYRESDYFNENEMVLFYVPSIKRYFITQPIFYNGTWVGGNYKLSSVLCVNFSEIYHKEVSITDGKVTIHGRITKVFDDSLGINWNQGQRGLPHFWQEPNRLVFKDWNL